jgi:hypothetical protein
MNQHTTRPSIGRALALAAALLCAGALCQPNLAYAQRGGGGAHGGGGGFHGGGGGFHGGGPGADHGFGGWHGGYGGWHRGYGPWYGGFGVGLGLGLTPYYYPYDWYDGDGDYGYGEPGASGTWYYCANPQGYYPYVTQCYSGWQAVPAG